MMQITQNVEMKELKNETALLITMTPDTNGEEVEQLLSPSPSQSCDNTTVKQNGVKCITSEDRDKFTNGQTQENVEKPFVLTSNSEQERNAGTDLDALLDKISSIVDRSPKEFHINNEGYDSNQIEHKKIDVIQIEDEMKRHNTTGKKVISEHESKCTANSGEEILKKIIRKPLDANVPSKSKDTMGKNIAELNVAKSPNQTQFVSEQMDKRTNGLEDVSFDEMGNEEKKVCTSKTDKASDKDDVIIDLDSSDEALTDEVTKPLQKVKKLEQDEGKQKEEICKILEEPNEKVEECVKEKIKVKEAELNGFIAETERSSYHNTMVKNSEVSDVLHISDKNEELKSNGLAKVDKAKIIEGFKENVQNQAQDEPVQAEEDDDDVIFFELIDKTKDKEKKKEILKKETEKLLEKKAELLTNKKDVEIVLVSEDEDDDLQHIKKKLEENDKEVTNTTDKYFQADNSDNACDQFDKLKPLVKTKSSSNDHHIDNNSNSSNLLRPAQDTNMPPTKRKRLSTEVYAKTIEEGKPETAVTDSEKPIQGKRGHNLVEISPSDIKKNQTSNKKLKTDDTDSNSSNDGTLQIDLDAKEEIEEMVSPCKEDREIHQLKPQPDFKREVKPIRLDFVKTFRKSFDKMSRQDLEELVLQKVVEGMLVKSEFADIRRQLDKYETTLANYRRKIAEVSKQFVDLETVHKRVLKDLETKNSQFTAPVRITRAVGLQVGMSMKAMKPDVHVSAQSNAAGGISTLPSGTLSKASTSPLRSPLRGVQSGRSPHQPLAHPHQQQSRPSPLPSSTISTTSSSFIKTLQPPSGSTPVRRGCMQKVTPQRPGPEHHITQTTSATPTSANRSPQAPRSALSVHVSKHTGGNSGGGSAVSTAGAMASVTAIRARSGTIPYPNMAQKQQSQQYQTSRPGPGPGPSPNKSTVKMPSKVRPIPTVSVPISSAAAGGSPPNLAPAKPKDKSVIDLTDEDEAAAAAAAIQSRLNQTASVTMKKSAGQGSGPGPVGGLARTGSSATGNVVRVSPMPGPSCRTNVVARLSGGGQRNTNVTMQIRSENTPPSASRLRYSHPAPLPSSPAQPFNPAWKLPPSRPVIRISLHDTGIVISWTLEDTSNRFTDCLTYQIYAYQETIHEPSTDSWRHVGDVKAMLLPMAVTLNQFQENQRYYFAVRGVDEHQRFGPFSLPKTWS